MVVQRYTLILSTMGVHVVRTCSANSRYFGSEDHAMTGSCSLWLMLVARLVPFLPLICAAPVHCRQAIIVKEDYRMTFVLAIKNNESGLQLEEYLFPENRGSVDDSGASQWPDLQLEPQMRFIPGLRLSSECGDQYFRCQRLLVETLPQSPQDSGGEFIIVCVPLETGLLLLSYWPWYNYRSMMMKWIWSTFIVNSSNCSPSVIYSISGSFYMVCVSSHQYIAVYEVLLNLSGSVIESATLTGPLINVNVSSSSNFSNFIILGHRIFFVIGNTIVVMDVLDSAQTQQYPELPECTQIHKLVPTSGAGNQQVLVAYCSDRCIYFDLMYGDWHSIQFSQATEYRTYVLTTTIELLFLSTVLYSFQY